MSDDPAVPQRPRMSEAHRRSFRAAYYLILDYHREKQSAAGRDASPIHPLTDRTF